VDTLHLALSCVQPTKLYVSKDGQRTVGPVHAVASYGPLDLRCPTGRLGLTVALNYLIIERDDERPDARFKVSTQRYQHAITDADGTEVIAWHWHPGESAPAATPHIHVTGATGDHIVRRGHVPTGRVTVEAVIRYALSELAATPNRQDWTTILDKCEGDFRTFATWGSRTPQ
jgi:hypothetical protein